MKDILKEVQSGEFAKEWLAECDNDRPNLLRNRKEHDELQIEQVGRKLREMMKWINE